MISWRGPRPRLTCCILVSNRGAMVRQEVGRREGRKPWVMKSSLRIVSIPGLFKGSSLKKKIVGKIRETLSMFKLHSVRRFFQRKKCEKKIVKFCLHSSYIHFDDFLTKTIEKQFVKFCLHSSFIHFDNLELENEVLRKNHE